MFVELMTKLLIIFLLLPHLQAEEKAETFATGDSVSKTNKLQFYLEHEKVKSLYLNCQKKEKNNLLKEKSIADCLWNNLDNDIKDEIQKGINPHDKDNNSEEISDSDKPNQNDDELDTSKGSEFRKYVVKVGSFNVNKEDPALKEISNYLYKRLEEALYGTDKIKGPKNVAHNRFYDLYKSQLSKNIINAMTTYCADAELIKDTPTGPQYTHFIIKDEETAKKNRKKNILALTNKLGDIKDKKSAIYGAWENCVATIQHICYREKTLRYDYKKDPLGHFKDSDYSITRACGVVSFLKSHRQNLLLTTKIQEAIKKILSAKGSLRAWAGRLDEYTGGKTEGEKNIDELTVITSDDFNKVYRKKMNKVTEDYKEKCLKEKNEKECEQFMYTGEEKKLVYKQLDEFDLRKKAVQEKVEKMADSGKKKEIARYLAEEGHSDNEIKDLFKEDKDFLIIKKKIKDHYKQERLKLVKSIRKKLNGQSSKKESIDFTDENSKNEDKETIKSIVKDLESRADRYQEIIHFNNIISGFLTIRSGDKEMQNTTGLFMEMDALNKQGEREPSSEEEPLKNGTLANIEKLKEKIENGGIKKIDDDDENLSKGGTGAMFEVKSLNENILNYLEKKEQK